MKQTDFLDFDEAVSYLKTNSSTLYKWLQAGKVPGHKLGRQWRFLREELDLHVSGKSGKIQIQKDALALAELLQSRSTHNQEKKMTPQTSQLTESLIWDAFDHGSQWIHIAPMKGKYEVSYRRRDRLESLTTFQEDFFEQFDQSLQDSSSPQNLGSARRMYLQRSEDEALQVRYQKVETVTGPKVTLQLIQPKNELHPFEGISGGDEKVLNTFKTWAKSTHGLILVTGLPGSGKTTTLFSFLNDLKNQGRVVYSLEDQVYMVIEGVSQVELKTRSTETFESSFQEIFASDPDVICFGLGSTNGLEKNIYSAAINAASTGHLVLLQMSLPTVDAALEEIKHHVSADVDSLLVGAVAQKLVSKPGGGAKAVYTFK